MFQLLNDENRFEHPHVALVDPFLSQLSIRTLEVVFQDVSHLGIEELGEELLVLKAVALRVLIQVALGPLTQKRYPSVDKLLDGNKGIFHLTHQTHLLLVLPTRNQSLLIEQMVFSEQHSKPIKKVFVKQQRRYLVLVFPLLPHVQLAIVNYLSHEL